MPEFIIRVDDVGQAVNQQEPDVGLEGFRRWWDAGGWAGLPVYLGVVVAPLGKWALEDYDRFEPVLGGGPHDWLRDHVKPPAEIALHGWDHRDRPLGLEDIRLSEESFGKARCIIPPHNKYDFATVDAMVETGKTILFGGFDGEHHNHGPAPKIVDGVLHLSAEKSLYDCSFRIADFLGTATSQNCPSVDWPLIITLHWRWDAGCKDAGAMDGVRRLRDLVADKLTTVDEAWRWATRRRS